MAPRTRITLWVAGIAVTALLLTSALTGFLIEKPLCDWLNGAINARLKGYSARVGVLDLHLWHLALTLRDTRLRQNAHPDTAILSLPQVDITIEWHALLRGRFVAEVVITRPTADIKIAQLRTELTDKTKLKDRGWQEVLEIYPLKFDTVQIRDGALSYTGQDAAQPVKISRLQVVARNIRHVDAARDPYPSPFELEGLAFGRGRVRAEGHANFLAVPHVTMKMRGSLAEIPLAALGPITRDYRVRLTGGLVSARGALEVDARTTRADLEDVKIADLHVDYLSAPDDPDQAMLKRAVVSATRRADNAPDLVLGVDSLTLENAEMGYVDTAADPAYRLFMTKANVKVRNFSNHAEAGTADFEGEGLFMDSGWAAVRGAFKPLKEGRHLDMQVAINGTELQTLNDLLRARAHVDVTQGRFSLFSQVRIRGQRIDGYVKPLFKDVRIYDPAQDEQKNLFRQLYEKLVDEISRVLQNKPREEVATVVDLSGNVSDPHASILQVIGNLIRNAFVQAILPGFEPGKVKREPAGAAAPLPKAPPSNSAATADGDAD